MAEEEDGMEKAFGLDGKELGAALRAYRKKQGLSIENLADENISATTISNIERGLPSVGADKTDYLMKKLGISLEKLLQAAEEHQKRREAIRIRLLSIEMMLDRGNGRGPGSCWNPSSRRSPCCRNITL
jgi:transcriptional regulator with XRE-family HTH domain